MICKRILPGPELRYLIREYIVAQFSFDDTTKLPPVRAYPANPDEAIRFLIKGKLFSTDPTTGITTERPAISIIGQPTARKDLQITHEFYMFYIRFQPGSLFKLFNVPMSMLIDQQIDATAIPDKEINELYEQLGSCLTYDAMISMVEVYFLKKLICIKNNSQPVDGIGRMILQNPQSFNLERTAKEACLSYRQFEKRFEQLVGITPKYFARITRFYQAFVLKESNPTLDWLSVAVRTGYTDYQHLAKDFKEFAGSTPNVLIKESLDSPSRAFPSSSEFRGV
jgi:AraC-like DNA-binding protein